MGLTVSLLLAKFLQTAARAGQAGVDGLAQKKTLEAARKGKGRKQKPGCTPCEALARVDAAKRFMKG